MWIAIVSCAFVDDAFVPVQIRASGLRDMTSSIRISDIDDDEGG